MARVIYSYAMRGQPRAGIFYPSTALPIGNFLITSDGFILSASDNFTLTYTGE